MSYLIQTAETNAFLQLAKFVADLLDDGQVSRAGFAELAPMRSGYHIVHVCRVDQPSQRLQDRSLWRTVRLS